MDKYLSLVLSPCLPFTQYHGTVRKDIRSAIDFCLPEGILSQEVGQPEGLSSSQK